MSSKLYKGNDKNIDNLIEQGTLTIVKYGATWCGPCKMIAPILEELSDTYGSVVFVDVDVDDEESSESTAKNGVSMVPTVIFYKNGKEIDRFVGFRPKEELEDMIKKYY